jgi:hypothetical protein
MTELLINGEMYRLRLNTRAAITLEKTLGRNPLEILINIENGELPKMTDIILIFHAMLQAYNHSVSLDKTYDLFDCYVAEGKTMFDFIQEVMVPVFQNSGFMSASNEPVEEKN